MTSPLFSGKAQGKLEPLFVDSSKKGGHSLGAGRGGGGGRRACNSTSSTCLVSSHGHCLHWLGLDILGSQNHLGRFPLSAIQRVAFTSTQAGLGGTQGDKMRSHTMPLSLCLGAGFGGDNPATQRGAQENEFFLGCREPINKESEAREVLLAQ